MTEPALTEDPPKRRRRGVAIALTVGALLLIGGYGAVVAAVSSEDVPAGTTVRGVEIGGLTAEQAVATLEESLGDEAATPVPVTAGGASTELDPATSGLSVDWEATVDQASGLILNPLRLVEHLTGAIEVEPITTTDDAALTASLESLAEVAAVEAVEPTITYTRKGRATMAAGVPGTALDVAGAVDTVSRAYLQLPYVPPVALPMTEVAPTVPDEEAQRVLRELAQPAVALPVTLRVGRPQDEPDEATRVEVSGRDIARVLTFDVADGTLEPELDGEGLHDALAEDFAPLERPGRNAAIVIRNGAPAIEKSRTGLAVDPDEVASAVMAVLPETTEARRVADVALSVEQPDFTTAEARALNIKEKLSSFRQWFPPAQYRYVNVGQAARYLNGTILEPGETFSMNDTIKERTPANGYTEGFIIQGGRFREELGGGVSIITTATWTAGFYAGLERVEQHPHGLYISRYEAGLEATVAWGLLDLRMRNDTGNGVLITATRYSDGVLIEMWGTKKFDRVTASFTNRYNYTDYQTIYDDGDKCVPSEGVRGFSISVTRRRFVDGKAVSTETWPTTYKPTPNVVCGPRP